MITSLLLLGGFCAVLYGLRWLIDLTWPPIVVRPPSALRRAARITRIDEHRARR